MGLLRDCENRLWNRWIVYSTNLEDGRGAQLRGARGPGHLRRLPALLLLAGAGGGLGLGLVGAVQGAEAPPIPHHAG